METRSSPPSVADQIEAALGGPGSIIVRQRRDHQRLQELVEEVRATKSAD